MDDEHIALVDQMISDLEISRTYYLETAQQLADKQAKLRSMRERLLSRPPVVDPGTKSWSTREPVPGVYSPQQVEDKNGLHHGYPPHKEEWR